ncbi:MAG: RICIN domain-containing protein [Coprococcus sp.]
MGITITAEHSGKVLDVAGGSTASGAVLQQYFYNGSNAQLWYFTNAGNGYYTIHSALGNCIDVWDAGTSNGTKIDCFAYNGTNAQKWKLTNAESKPLENGTYSFTNISSNKVLSVNGSSTENSANVLCDK